MPCLLTAYTRKLGIFSDSLEIILQCIAIVLMEGVDIQTLISACIFSSQLSFHFLWYRWGELNVKQGNQVLIFTSWTFPFSSDLCVWFSSAHVV